MARRITADDNSTPAVGRGSTAYPPGSQKVSYGPGEGYRESFREPYRGSRVVQPAVRHSWPWYMRKRVMFPLVLVIAAVGMFLALWLPTLQGQSFLQVTHRLVQPHLSLQSAFMGSKQMHVLLVGVDDVPGVHGAGPSHRSDSMLVASTDFDSKQIRVVSIPRDGWEPHYLNGQMIDAHQKLGHTYAEGGVQCTKETIEHLLNVPIEYYVVINFKGFQKVIDAIGGIDVNVKEKMDYDDSWGHLHIHLKPGLQHMDGQTAMGYARFRHDTIGDIGRMSRQQEVLKIMLEKMKEPYNLPRLPSLFRIFQQNVETNMSMDQLIALAQHMSEFGGDGMQTMTVENYGPYDGPAYPWGRHSFEGRSMAQYIPDRGLEAARAFLEDLTPPPPPDQQLDDKDKGWQGKGAKGADNSGGSDASDSASQDTSGSADNTSGQENSST